MTPEQQIRLACLSMALGTDACAECALEIADEFAEFVFTGDMPEDDDEAEDFEALIGAFGCRR